MDERIIAVAEEVLTQKAEQLKKELQQQRDLTQAIEALEHKKDELLNLLHIFAEEKVPQDIIDFYIRNRGKVWVSKILGCHAGTRIELQAASQWLLLGMDTALAAGPYRFIVMAIRADVHVDELGFYQDDYGNRLRLNDCY